MSDTAVAAYATAKAFWGAHHEAIEIIDLVI
jgi:hypothetical protein